MYILALETTGPISSAAILDENGKVLSCDHSNETMSHLKDLVPMIDRITKRIGISVKDIDVIAPSIGPGSYTGIRIGVATARALAQALDIKLFNVPSITGGMLSKESVKNSDAVGIGIINARRNQVYAAIDGYLKEGPYMISDIIEKAKEIISSGKKVLFIGDGIDQYQANIENELEEGTYSFLNKDDRYQDAVSIGSYAVEHMKMGEKLSTYLETIPMYMRKVEAEEKLSSGKLSHLTEALI